MSIRYLFCINAGRSGSEYLTELLRCARGTIVEHEPLPVMNSGPMEAYNAGDDAALRNLMPRKWRTIRRRLGRHAVYAETNHSFVKGWGWLVPDQLAPQEEIGVVILHRDAERTADSLLRIHDVPGSSLFARAWYLAPDAARSLGPPPSGASPFDLCLWYVHEIQRRADAYREAFPRITFHDCDLEELNDEAGVRRLYDAFGLQPDSDLASVVGEPRNRKEDWPRRSRAELLDRPAAVNPDTLPDADRDTLIGAIVEFVDEERRSHAIPVERDRRHLGTLATSAVRVVATLQSVIEARWKLSLSFTEAERTVINELVYRWDRGDPCFLFAKRHRAPGLSYTYDFNVEIGPWFAWRTLGWRGLLRTTWAALRMPR